MMNVLLTGGGFLGLRIAAQLAAAGRSVRILDVMPAHSAGWDWRVGDVASFDSVAGALDGCTHVLHLAALLTPACAADPLRGALVNLLGTLNVFEAARRAGLKQVVHASSAGVYGPDDPTQPRPTTLYGTWKLAAEGIARSYWADHGIGSVGLRPFVVYGAGRESRLSSGPSLACRAAARGAAYTIAFTGRTGLVYVEDFVHAFIAALTPARAGAFVVDLPGVVVSMDDLIAEIRCQAPGARIDAQGPPLPIAADIAQPDLSDVLGALPITPPADGVAATLAACRSS